MPPCDLALEPISTLVKRQQLVKKNKMIKYVLQQSSLRTIAKRFHTQTSTVEQDKNENFLFKVVNLYTYRWIRVVYFIHGLLKEQMCAVWEAFSSQMSALISVPKISDILLFGAEGVITLWISYDGELLSCLISHRGYASYFARKIKTVSGRSEREDCIHLLTPKGVPCIEEKAYSHILELVPLVSFTLK